MAGNWSAIYSGGAGVWDVIYGSAVTHDTSGALTGPGSTVAGLASRRVIHATSGAVVGPGAQLSGIARGPGGDSGFTPGGGSGGYAETVIKRRRHFEVEQQLDRQRRAQRAAEEDVEERERALVRAKSEATREREQARLAKAVERQAKEARLTELIAEQLVALSAELPESRLNDVQSAVQSRDNEEEDAILLLLLQ